MSNLEFTRRLWSRAAFGPLRQNRVEVLFLVAATFLSAVTQVRAASNAPSQAVCDVSADYALGSEDYAEAIRLHEKVLRRDPNDALAHYHLGFAYGMSHDAAGELREYLRAEQLSLRQWDLFLNLGLLYLGDHQVCAARRAGANLADPTRNLSTSLTLWRSGRDSNPQYRFRYGKIDGPIRRVIVLCRIQDVQGS
jgi:tetratricopeptide (TPR) repeat protein